MVIKIYISGISGNKEVKKRQQRVLMILDSKNIKYDVVDITEPGSEDAKEFMQNNAKSFGATIGDANPRSPLPPQLFNDEDYCGDYDLFDTANEIDEIEKFLKLEPSDESVVTSSAEIKLGNGEIETVQNDNDNEAEAKKESSVEKEVVEKEKGDEGEEKEEVKEDEEKGKTEEVEEEAPSEKVNEDEVVTSETNVETENKTEETKLENGNAAEEDSLTTEVEA